MQPRLAAVPHIWRGGESNRQMATPATEAADATLLAAMRDGNEAALALLYDRYATPIYALAFRITGDRQAAQEVLQDTFLRAWNHAATFDTAQGTCSAWLFTIARRRALDILRSRQRRVSTATTGHFVSDGGSVPDPSQPDESNRIVLAETMTQALAQLPRIQRQAIELAYFGGLSHQQIATETNTPLGTVKSRLRAALDALRTHLLVGQDRDKGNQ